MSDRLWTFSQVEQLYGQLTPLTPYGAVRFERKEILRDRVTLEQEYDRVDAALALTRRDRPRLDRLTHHLRRIPLLPALDPAAALDANGIFLVKKFLVNYRTIFDALDSAERQAFGLPPAPGTLLDRLNTGGDAESFYLEDRYDPDLAAVRDRIRAKNRELEDVRTQTIERLREARGLDFRLRDFLVVDSEAAAGLDPREVYVEPYDSRHVTVRPVWPAGFFARLPERDELLREERHLEQKILNELSALAVAAGDALRACAAAVERLDWALARAALAERFGLTRPVLQEPGRPLRVAGGRFPPLEARCAESGERYWPLDAAFRCSAVVIHGSNLCGKTVALKTLSLLQLAAQLGLFVPAARFETIVFERLDYIGAECAGDDNGLGSFGREVALLADALREPVRGSEIRNSGAAVGTEADPPNGRSEVHGPGSAAAGGTGSVPSAAPVTRMTLPRGAGTPTLLVLDEYARATNSREAAALLAGLLAWLDGHPSVHAFLATHYTELPAFPNVLFCRLRGLGPDGASPVAGRDLPLADRARALRRQVEYVLLTDDERQPHQDALRVAEWLGLDPAIVARARDYLEGNHERQTRTR
jgi:hypothetical protein